MSQRKQRIAKKIGENRWQSAGGRRRRMRGFTVGSTSPTAPAPGGIAARPPDRKLVEHPAENSHEPRNL